MALIATVVFLNLFEFIHHYHYPEALKEWINQGKSVEEFTKNYDNATILQLQPLRYLQYLLIIWLSLLLYKLKQIKIWNPIVMTIFGLMGFVSATVIYVTQFNIPKGFEILLFLYLDFRFYYYTG